MTDPTTSPSEESGSGLLGSIAGALSSFDGDATPVTAARPTTVPPADELAIDDLATRSSDPTVSPWGSSLPNAVERPIEASANALAHRLLSATDRNVAHDTTPSFVLIETDSGATRPIGQRLTIGRAASDRSHSAHDEHMIVDLAVVSRRHCELVTENSTVVIHDLGAANGTFVRRDNEVIRVGNEPIKLHNGDVIATAQGHRAIAEFRALKPGGTS